MTYTTLTNLASLIAEKVTNEDYGLVLNQKRYCICFKALPRQDKIFFPLQKGAFWLGQTVLCLCVCTCANDNNHTMYTVQHINDSIDSNAKVSGRPFND